MLILSMNISANALNQDILVEEGAEAVIPGLYDFLLYCIYNAVIDTDLYGEKKAYAFIVKIACKILVNFQKKISDIVAQESDFTPPTVFTQLLEHMDDTFIGIGTKMGERCFGARA